MLVLASNYVWWSSGAEKPGGPVANPVNFGGWSDPEVDKLLETGRTESDPAKRAEIYKNLDKRMATQVHGSFAWFTPWAVVEDSKVHNVFGPPLPGDDPSQGGQGVDDGRGPPTQHRPGHRPLPPRVVDRQVGPIP